MRIEAAAPDHDMGCRSLPSLLTTLLWVTLLDVQNGIDSKQVRRLEEQDVSPQRDCS